jgi:hypothetical protein
VLIKHEKFEDHKRHAKHRQGDAGWMVFISVVENNMSIYFDTLHYGTTQSCIMGFMSGRFLDP